MSKFDLDDAKVEQEPDAGNGRTMATKVKIMFYTIRGTAGKIRRLEV